MLNTNELFELDACEFASIIVNDSTEAPDIHVNSTTNIHEVNWHSNNVVQRSSK